MENEQLGSLLREYRERYNVSQEDLAFDLCAVSTLSQLEAGTAMPGRELLTQLFGRLGMTSPAVAGKAQGDKALIEMQIARKIAEQDYDLAALLDAYAASDDLDLFEKQFCGYHRAVYLRYSGAETEILIAELEAALNLTLHAYREDGLPARRYYTKLELSLLSELALAYADAGDRRGAVALAEYVQDYVENRLINEYDAADGYPALLQHLAEWQLEAGQAQKALNAAEKGIAACARFGALFPLAPLVRAKGEALHLLGREAEKCLTDARRLVSAIGSAGTTDASSASTSPRAASPQ